jgi:serine/threonine protein kinase
MKEHVCSYCGAAIPEEDYGVYGRDTEPDEVLCSKCSGTILDSTESIPVTAGMQGKTLFCCKCLADVSKAADFDGLAYEFPDSMYLCPNCVRSMEKNAQAIGSDDYYVVLEEIGKGGMGTVYKAVHKDTGRVCALKKINPDALDNPRSIKIFEREMMVQSKVVHPNLVRIMDKGIVSSTYSTYYFVMEYIPGGNVPNLMNKMKGMVLDPKTACAITVDVLEGLHALHSNGFIHRDIKPSNILLGMPDEDGARVAKICDYGLAKSFVKSGNSYFDITKTQGGFAGSIMFMSPDIIRNFKYAKPVVDLYSTGVTLYFMLTAKYTVDIPGDELDGTGMTTFQRHPLEIVLDETPIPILSRRPGIPKALAAIVDKSVSKDLLTDNGYTYAKEFKTELENVMEAEGWIE